MKNKNRKYEFISEIGAVEFGEVLKRKLTIPKYQRDFAWEDEHVDAFLDDIDDILNHLQIQTKLKEEIAKIIFSTDEIRIKRINLTKLKKKGLDKSFITLFKKLLEYMEQI